jgi:putative transposase
LAEKKDWAFKLSVREKKAMIDADHPKLSIARQCELISLSRASYYRSVDTGIGIETPENLELMRLIDEEYTRHPFYGSRQLRNYFRRQGRVISRKRIQRLMRIMGLFSIAPKPNTSKRNKEHKTYPYLLRDLVIDRPNQVWCTDITYIPMQGGFVYLVAIMDWYSRKVLAWEVSNSMEDTFCISALESAIRLYGVPEVFNTDQGSQFTSIDFIAVLKQQDIKISMDGRGRWMDNVFIERLWRSVKYEDIYLKDYRTVVTLKQGLTKYFRFYNNERPHQSFDSCTPAEVYAAFFKAVA